jgi:hypothetical protein
MLESGYTTTAIQVVQPGDNINNGDVEATDEGIDAGIDEDDEVKLIDSSKTVSIRVDHETEGKEGFEDDDGQYSLTQMLTYNKDTCPSPINENNQISYRAACKIAESTDNPRFGSMIGNSY